jgi:hypothetical protein
LRLNRAYEAKGKDLYVLGLDSSVTEEAERSGDAGLVQHARPAVSL